MNRKELFHSFKDNAKEIDKCIRPPYYEKEELFLALCPACEGDCAKVCETDVIKILKDKTPILDFSDSGCTYCDKCAEVCKYKVLTKENKKQIEAIIKIDKNKCLSWQGTMCFSCKDPCLDNAIEFENAVFYPKITSNCTNCGFCIKYCPTNAIISIKC